MQQDVGVQLWVGRLVGDGAGGGVPPAGRDQPGRFDVIDAVVGALADHVHLVDGVCERAIDRAFVRGLDLGAQLQGPKRPHRGDGLGGGEGRVDRADRLAVAADAPQRQPRRAGSADGHQRVQLLACDRPAGVGGDGLGAADPPSRCLDPHPVFEVVVAQLGFLGAAVQVGGVPLRLPGGDLRDGQHRAGEDQRSIRPAPCSGNPVSGFSTAINAYSCPASTASNSSAPTATPPPPAHHPGTSTRSPSFKKNSPNSDGTVRSSASFHVTLVTDNMTDEATSHPGQQSQEAHFTHRMLETRPESHWEPSCRPRRDQSKIPPAGVKLQPQPFAARVTFVSTTVNLPFRRCPRNSVPNGGCGEAA